MSRNIITDTNTGDRYVSEWINDIIEIKAYKCLGCGSKFDSMSKFCGECGKKLVNPLKNKEIIHNKKPDKVDLNE